MRFEFATAGRVIFGTGVLKEVGQLAEGFGKYAFVVTGRSPDRAAILLNLLDEKKITSNVFSVEGEPTTEIIRIATERAREAQCEFIVGFGGGSVIDTAKAIAALIANGGEPLDYLEVIGRGKAITRPSIPFVAIPTTSGTGAEVTHNAVMESLGHKVKVSLRSPHMFAKIALIDPDLMCSAPPEVTANTGLDALTQLIEPFLSNQANPMTDAICREGIRRVARSLRKAYFLGNDLSAREDMAIASLFGGMALANAKLGAVHGFAGPLGGMYRKGHGALCAALLPHVMEINLSALRERARESEVLKRFEEVAQLLKGDTRAKADEGIEYVRELCECLKISSLSSLGIKREEFSIIIEKANASSSMKGNPIRLNRDELHEILEKAM